MVLLQLGDLKTRKDKEVVERVIQLYNDGYGFDSIGRKEKIAPNTVRRILEINGIARIDR